ncbi:hypothetical protein [Paenibacillus lemnae]|uniref:Uncharacterized protein n=1 Tax=Paenibacillus lemnae TaxID=1330551 RepID=A0A848M4Q9_PAELE|nr:hypothetical protein [Paenibacillus lemnae]NMO95917.1 hypothetical protein [Paenibacillus lemnae]
MKSFSRYTVLFTIVLVASLSFGAMASADFTYWFNDGSSTWAQLYYTNDQGAWALPIYQNSFGDVFNLSDVQEIQVVYLNR